MVADEDEWREQTRESFAATLSAAELGRADFEAPRPSRRQRWILAVAVLGCVLAACTTLVGIHLNSATLPHPVQGYEETRLLEPIVAEMVRGRTELEVEAMAHDAGWVTAIESRDGISRPHVLPFLTNRIRLDIRGGIVTEASLG